MTFDLPALLAYVRENPLATLVSILGFALVVYLLQRKPTIQRNADQRLAELRKTNSGRYDRLRPPE